MKKFWDNIENKVLVIIALTTAASVLTVYLITTSMTYRVMIDDMRNRGLIINKYAQNALDTESFLLNNQADESLPVYTRTQQKLNDIRQIGNVRYLYTARRSPDGGFIYLVDGLELGADDFRFPGDPIEAEIVPKLQQCYDEAYLSGNDIDNTGWGNIYLTCKAIQGHNGDTIGLLVMEFDAEKLATQSLHVKIYSILFSLIIACFFIWISRQVLHRVSESYYKKLAYTDALTGLQNRLSFEEDLARIEKDKEPHLPICLVIYDLNRLKLVNDTLGHASGDAYIKKMASLLTADELRSMGHSYRTGGDEFATITTGHNPAEVEAKLRALFEQTRSLGSVKTFFEFAYGLSCYDPNLDRNLHDAMSRADSQMYSLKKASSAHVHTGNDKGLAPGG